MLIDVIKCLGGSVVAESEPSTFRHPRQFQAMGQIAALILLSRPREAGQSSSWIDSIFLMSGVGSFG